MSDYIEGPCSICGKEECIAVYPLLPGEPKFCREHYTPEFAEPYGVDFSGPDDFDIPYEGESDPEDEEWG